MSQQLSRRQFGALALTGVGTTFLLAGCGTSATPSSGGSATPVSTANAFKTATLNFMWWTNPLRSQYTDEIITAYTKAHSAITVNQQPGQWATYWTKLSTMVAGQTAPDIIQMDQAYIAEYGGRGALLDMKTVGTIDTDPLKSTLDEGILNGKLYGIPTGNNAYAYGANRSLFKKAGVAVPDDTKWTWNDYLDLTVKLAKASGGEFAGGTWGATDTDLQIWLHQHGEQLYTAKGKLGYTLPTVTAWFTLAQKFFKAGGAVSDDAFIADQTASVQQTSFGTNKSAIFNMWSNQISAYQQANQGDCVLLRLPSVAGSASKNGLYYKPSMYWSISSQSKYPAQAGALVNQFLNTTEAAKLQLAERGVPANPKVLAVVKPLLSAYDQVGVDYMNNIKSEIKWVPPVPPKGTSTMAAVVLRHVEDVMYGRATPTQAAQAFDSETKSLLAAAGQ
jgi:multiple sugar transport system substrate-binding protein